VGRFHPMLWKDRRIVAPDQQGHGLSSKPVCRYAAEEMATDILELLRYLHMGSAVLVGHSLGGYVAGYLAAYHPNCVRALAILDKSASGPIEAAGIPLEAIEAVDPITRDWPLPFASLREAQDRIRKDMNPTSATNTS
jgi:pimeloyl-ACP methyl ester carboxylesterase